MDLADAALLSSDLGGAGGMAAGGISQGLVEVLLLAHTVRVFDLYVLRPDTERSRVSVRVEVVGDAPPE